MTETKRNHDADREHERIIESLMLVSTYEDLAEVLGIKTGVTAMQAAAAIMDLVDRAHYGSEHVPAPWD